jgi:hypothetical protein
MTRVPALPLRTDAEFRFECLRLVGVIDLNDTSRGAQSLGSVNTSDGVNPVAATAA